MKNNRENWWEFTYDSFKVMTQLGKVRAKQGLITICCPKYKR